MIKLQNIINGWANYYFPAKEVEQLAHARAAVCSTCPEAVPSVFHEIIDNKPEAVQGLVCGVCSCPLSKKTRSVTETCPLNKWTN